VLEITRNRSCALRVVGVLMACSLFAIAAAPPARADTTYTYTGTPFTEFLGADACTAGVGECHISFSFTVASLLPDNFVSLAGATGQPGFTPLSFSITDGVHTLTNVDSMPYLFVETGNDGRIDQWYASVYSPGSSPDFLLGTSSVDYGQADTTITYGSYYGPVAAAGNLSDEGTWTISATPEPSSLVLLVMGFLGVAGAWRRKKLAQNS
jgi:PEP-CTERM motif